MLAAVLIVVILTQGGSDGDSVTTVTEAGASTSTPAETTTSPPPAATLDLTTIKPKVARFMSSFIGKGYTPEPECPARVTRAAGVTFNCVDIDGDGLHVVVAVTQTDDRGGTILRLTQYERTSDYIEKFIKDDSNKSDEFLHIRAVTCLPKFNAATLPSFKCRTVYVNGDVRYQRITIKSQNGKEYDYSTPGPD